ncbi:MAG: VOC family protein [Myxococcaceae bacterium]
MTNFLVNVDVPDLKAATRFYTDAFELRIGRRFGDDVVELVGGPAPMYLLAKRPGTEPFAGASTRRDYARHWSPVHLDFIVQDLELAIARAEAAGAVRESEISERTWGRIAFMADPFGNGFCLLQFKDRGYDEIATERAT